MRERLLQGLASLKLTVACLAAAVALVFFGTLAQRDLGLHEVQKRYFQSLFVTWNPPGLRWHIPVFPGGYLLGGLLLVNLGAVYLRRNAWTKGRLGLLLIHTGLGVLLVGQLAADLLSRESALSFAEGEARNYSEAFRETELALVDTTDPDSDLVAVVAEKRLARGGLIRLPGLPLTLRVQKYWRHAAVLEQPAPGSVPSGATRGAGQHWHLLPKPVVAASEERRTPAVLVEILSGTDLLGSWLAPFGFKQSLTHAGRTYQLALRPARYYMPFALRLLRATHEVYPGSDIPKNFQSRVRIEHPAKNETREVDIYMNNPLRYEGLTFYQYQMGRDELDAHRGTSVLQVVRNPSWLTPYVACMLVTLGLTVQFLSHLISFIRERVQSQPAVAADRPGLDSAAGREAGLAVAADSAAVRPRAGLKFKNLWPWLIPGLCSLWVVASAKPPRDAPGRWATQQFGRLPVVANGRVQPLDSLARNSLLQLREKQRLNLEPWKSHWRNPRLIGAIDWLLELSLNPEQADARPVFRVDNPDLKGLLALPAEPDPSRQTDGKHYSWNQIAPRLEDLRREAQRAAALPAGQRRPYDRAVLRLWQGTQLYQRLKRTFSLVATGNLDQAQAEFARRLQAGRTAWRARMEAQDFDAEALSWVAEQYDAPLVVPPPDPKADPDGWLRMAEALALMAQGQPPPLGVMAYARMASAYRSGQVLQFNQAVTDYLAQLQPQFAAQLRKVRAEQVFNHWAPFYKALTLYVLAGLLTLGFWMRPQAWDWLRRAGLGVGVVALLLHTAGLVFRMALEGRPPVTNLYSSAVFVGWGAAVLGLVLERFWRNGVGVIAAAVVGFVSLIIAHHLALGGDTLEMMRAVLDNNFWLATHVVTVTLGYSATFVAGFLAIVYVVRGTFSRAITPELERALARMVYGIVCFATLFTFVGTVTGGIWADQAWGRFWGWDPKENGALMLVLWLALILHARWRGLVGPRGLMNLAIGGNIVTAWAWFGVNMLGIGLHSYGFMDAAMRWLVVFVASQLGLIGLGLLPRQLWRSVAPADSGAQP